jgi:uncharacterized protein (TIGR02594 family)
MAFELDDVTALKAMPSTDAETLITTGATLDQTGKKFTDDHHVEWVNVYLPPPLQTIDGWVKSTDGQPVPDPAPLPLDPEMFVRQCTLVDRRLNSDPVVAPNFVSADFLIARAIVETGMTPTAFTAPFCTGPFRLAQTEWDDFLKSGLQTHSLFQPADVIYPMAQVYAAGFSMHAAGKGFADAWSAANPPGDNAEPFVPSYLDLFHVYLTDVETAVKIRKNETDSVKPLTQFIDSTFIEAIGARPALNEVKRSRNISEFVAVTEAALAKALDAAFDKIKTLAPDELPRSDPNQSIIAGSAPWLQVAQAEMAMGVSGQSAPARIRSYFAAIPQNIGSAIPAWCGAFAAFCMKQSANGNTVPGGAAIAANWKSWGSQSIPLGSHDLPVGAVVVLTEVPTATGPHGHVAFFSAFDESGRNVQLLGGNQSDAVKISSFPITRVAAIRVLQTAAAVSGAANGFDLTNAGVKREFQKYGDLIVDRFRRAGFTQDRHLRTALANAIAESGLDPDDTTGGGEDSVGLFQCNRKGGLGQGFSVPELKDPETNIAIILRAARATTSFSSASSLQAAMEAFVKFVERPKDTAGEIANRMDIANKL